MKIYTNTYDLRQPSEKKFWVSPHSDFKIGISVLGYNGTNMSYPPSSIDLYKDSEKLTVDSNDGRFTYWKIKSEDTGEVTYTVKAIRNDKVVGELSLVQVVTDSTVFEQEQEVKLDNLEDIKVNGQIEVENGDFTAKILPDNFTEHSTLLDISTTNEDDTITKQFSFDAGGLHGANLRVAAIEQITSDSFSLIDSRQAECGTNGIDIQTQYVNFIQQNSDTGEVSLKSTGLMISREGSRYPEKNIGIFIDPDEFYIWTPNYNITVNDSGLFTYTENGDSAYGFDFANNAVILQNAIFAPKEINGETVLAYIGNINSEE